VQLWADGGVLRSTQATDRAGTGVHREFAETEVRLAALLVPFAKLGIPIGRLRQFAEEIRPILSLLYADVTPDSLDERTLQIGTGLKRAVNGVGENYLSLAYTERQVAISVRTATDGSLALNPRRDFPGLEGLDHAPIVVLDLTSILHGLLD
jgi:hypothetical protein